MNAHQNNNKKLSKILSTKISIGDYNAFLILTKLEYQAGLIKQESTSELLRLTIRHILNQVRYQPEYHILIQQQKALNQQQVTMPVAQDQVPNISRINSLVGQKMTPWKLSSLLSTQTNHHNALWW
jgi:hypothetical protein